MCLSAVNTRENEATDETKRHPIKTEVSPAPESIFIFPMEAFLGVLYFKKHENKINCIYWFSFLGFKGLKIFLLVIESENKRTLGQSSLLS